MCQMQHFPFPACREMVSQHWTPRWMRVMGPGAFKFDHLESTKPILEKKISTLFMCQMQHFPFPACREKGTPKYGSHKWLTPKGVWPWGTQIGPFAVHKTYFCKMNFHFINRPHAAFPFSCIQWNGHPTMYPIVSDTKGCMTLGHSNWTICSPRNLFLQNEFPLY